MKIGIVFDRKQDYGIKGKNEDYCDFCFFSEAEAAYKNFKLMGHDVLYIGNPSNLLNRIKTNSIDCDIIYNIAEGYKSRNREGLVPSICEAFNIPYTGTDAFGLSLSLHKYQTNCFIEKYNIPVPKSFIYIPNLDSINEIKKNIKKMGMNYPLVIKPNHEGSSMGLKLVNNINCLESALLDLSKRFRQEIIIQEYIYGKELSTCILGTGDNSRVYSSVEYTTTSGKNIDLFSTKLKNEGGHIMLLPRLDKRTLNKIEKQALFIHKIMGIRDVSRIDWRFDITRNKAFFIELTPLPDLSEDSEFCWASKMLNKPYSYVFYEIIKSASLRYNINL